MNNNSELWTCEIEIWMRAMKEKMPMIKKCRIWDQNRAFTKIRDKTGPKIKNYNVIFYTRSAANEFTRKLLQNFADLHFFPTENKKTFSQNYK